jgi:hypothetical protein
MKKIQLHVRLGPLCWLQSLEASNFEDFGVRQQRQDSGGGCHNIGADSEMIAGDSRFTILPCKEGEEQRKEGRPLSP